MARVEFTVQLQLPVSAESLWSALVDWGSHGDWIPATRVVVHAPGPMAEFTATSGLGPLTLPDRMRVVEFDEGGRRAAVEKLGPVLTGGAGFKVTQVAGGARLEWWERVEARWLPGWLTPVAAWAGAFLFRLAIRRLGRQLGKKSAGGHTQ